MPSTQNAVNNHEYRSVPITALAESATNPRKRFDAKSLEELAASFKTQGILAPLLVRELEESKYEVVAGARRLRAAKLAELEKLPVRVVKLTDAEAIEAQCVENLQREDIHPLEEALGFKSLLELGEPAYTIATIASRAGKSEAYVYGRIRLADLIPPVAEAFLKDQITIGHALLIAKLPASQQQEAFSAAFRGLWTSEGNSQVLIPVRELAAWIESNILLQLASAPFDKQDETLVPEAGSCVNCPKRTGFNKLLFPDVRKGFMHFARLFPGQDRRFREKDSGNQAAANPDFGGVEFPRGRSLGTESVCGVGDQESQAERRKHQALTRSETL